MIFLGLHAGISEQQTYLTIMKKGGKQMGLCSIPDPWSNSVLLMPSAAVVSSTEL